MAIGAAPVYRCEGCEHITVILLAAIPPVLITTYTTPYYGTYGETLLLGNVILWLGYEVVYGRWLDSAVAWSVLGAISGLAFWTFGLIAVYILPIALLGLWKHRAALWKHYLLCGAGFLAGSYPWWAFNLANDWGALFALITPNYSSSSLFERVFSLFLFNIPALIGLRFPWRPDFCSHSAGDHYPGSLRLSRHEFHHYLAL